MQDTLLSSDMAALFWLHVHWFFTAFSLVGFILLTVWAWRNLPKDKLKSFSIWLLVVGIVGTLATASLASAGFRLIGHWSNGG